MEMRKFVIEIHPDGTCQSSDLLYQGGRIRSPCGVIGLS